MCLSVFSQRGALWAPVYIPSLKPVCLKAAATQPWALLPDLLNQNSGGGAQLSGCSQTLQEAVV